MIVVTLELVYGIRFGDDIPWLFVLGNFGRAALGNILGISDEDADLFLTGTDEDSLTAQAKRLAAREDERKKKNNVSPREGTHQSPQTDEMREFTRNLFADDGA